MKFFLIEFLPRSFFAFYLRIFVVLAVTTGLTSIAVSPANAQSKSFSSLEDSVYQFNNQLKFGESQALLLPVLQSEAFSNDEKYQACLLLAYTYKRVQDYQSSFLFLAKAREFAGKTKNKARYEAGISAQEALAHFDIHDYAKSDSLMRALESTGFRYIDLENRAKLVMQQGYLLFLAEQYPRAEATYDRAIGWLHEIDPCDLPMIYVKKMQLYDAMRESDKMLAAFRESGRYADSCGIIKYDIYAHEELLHIYESHNDPAAMAISRRLDSLNEVYDQTANVAALHNQKETMLLAAQERKLQTEQTYRTYLTLGLGAAGLLLLVLLAWSLLHYRKKRVLETEFFRMKGELEAYLAQQTQAPLPDQLSPVAKGANASSGLASTPLSARQQQVLDYLAAGLSNRDIADKLSVSENTVKYHIRNIYEILDIRDRKDLFVKIRK